MKLKVTVNGTAYEVDVEVQEEKAPALGTIVVGGAASSPVASAPVAGVAAGNAVPAPLAGSVFKILVEPGQEVAAGEVLLILEAMKMETEINSPKAGVVSEVLVAVGDAVQAGQGLVALEDAGEAE